MAQITEDYVSFEIAKLLKEKGFEGYSIFTIYDENAANAYIKELKEKHLLYSSDDPKLKEFYYTKPTLQMAMKWLREVHKIHIETRCLPNNAEAFVMTIEELPRCLCRGISSNKYEETCEAAIKYCLDNLI